MSNDDEMKKHPAWKEALRTILKKFETKEFTYDTVIPHSFFNEQLDIQKPSIHSYTTSEEYDKALDRWKLAKLAFMENLKKELIDNHNMDLQNDWRKGFKVIHPKKQTARATEYQHRVYDKVNKQVFKRITNVNMQMLSDEQRRENTDAIAKLAALQMFIKNSRKRKRLDGGSSTG